VRGIGSTSLGDRSGAYGCHVTTESDIREFLTTRRARLTPHQAGLPSYGRQRRVAGLRREEVALLAGISVEYYTRLERGNARGVSETVLDAISGALQLDEAEHAHLLDLVRTVNDERPPRRSSGPVRVRPSVQRLVDAMGAIPAFVRNGRLDILYANALGEALYSEHYRDPVRPPNSARFAFLDPRARAFYSDWDTTVHDMVAALRGELGRNPYDRRLSDLVGLLSTRSEEFRVEWARHDVRFHRTGTKRVHHPLVGDLVLAYEVLELPADPGLELVTYSAEPGSRSETALHELAEWSTTRARLKVQEREVAAPEGDTSPD
jgi:transcriptional regulator with XRE-family HTH domain